MTGDVSTRPTTTRPPSMDSENAVLYTSLPFELAPSAEKSDIAASIRSLTLARVAGGHLTRLCDSGVWPVIT